MGTHKLELYSDKAKAVCGNRYINVGIAEQNMTALAAGLALEGNTVFTYSLGNFPSIRCLEQIRNDICYHRANVKILAVGGGLVYGNQGITHHATEDLALMRVMPNMRVYVPGDAYEAIECLKDAYNYKGPAYIRLARNKEKNFHNEYEKLDISKIQMFGDYGEEIQILSCGSILCEALKLKDILEESGIKVGVASIPRIKPIDKDGIGNLANLAKLLITIEEHQIAGGLGGTIAEIISEISTSHAIHFLKLLARKSSCEMNIVCQRKN